MCRGRTDVAVDKVYGRWQGRGMYSWSSIQPVQCDHRSHGQVDEAVGAEMNVRHSCGQIVGSALTLDCFALIAGMIGCCRLLLWLPQTLLLLQPLLPQPLMLPLLPQPLVLQPLLCLHDWLPQPLLLLPLLPQPLLPCCHSRCCHRR